MGGHSQMFISPQVALLVESLDTPALRCLTFGVWFSQAHVPTMNWFFYLRPVSSGKLSSSAPFTSFSNLSARSSKLWAIHPYLAIPPCPVTRWKDSSLLCSSFSTLFSLAQKNLHRKKCHLWSENDSLMSKINIGDWVHHSLPFFSNFH